MQARGPCCHPAGIDARWNGESLALASFIYEAKTNAWHAGAPKTMQRPRVGSVLAFLDGALITVFGQDTTSPTPFA